MIGILIYIFIFKTKKLIDFQLTYARKSWVAEKDAWRAVIQLNFVRTINAILDVVANEFLISDTGASEMDEIGRAHV